MKAKDRPRFDVDALRELAGDKVFARGKAYERDGQVNILALEPGRVLAEVAGTEDYRTELTGRGRKIDGECSCPAFEDWGFCKHMVAVGLAANAAVDDAEDAGALARIRDHLMQQGTDALVAMIMDLAERDLALFRRLDTAAAAVGADDKTLEMRLRKAIDAATHTRGFVDYAEARGWADSVNEALNAIADLALGMRAGLALKLTDRAIERIEQAIEQIDDSDGHCGALLQRAGEIHLLAVRAAKPDPVKLARELFAREMASEYGTFYRALATYAEVLGDRGLAEYRRMAVEAWENLPSQGGGTRARREVPEGYERLKDMLDFFAEREGDLETRIKLRSKDLSSPWDYLQLAEFCLAQGRREEALRRAEEGLWMFEDGRPDQRLVSFAVDLLAKSGRKSDAEAHLWRAFEKAPDLELYTRLRKLGGKAARERAVKQLENRLADAERTPWNHLADLLVQILTREKMLDTAWSTIRKHGVSMSIKEALARQSEPTHPKEALTVYCEHVDQLANTGGDPAYMEASKLVARMATLRTVAEQTGYVAALKARFGASATS